MNASNEKMKWILFWVFLTLFVLSVLGTLGVVFLGFGTPNESERELLVKGLIGEIAICVVALFYSVFGLKKNSFDTSQQLSELETRVDGLEQKMIYSTKEFDEKLKSIPSSKKEVLGHEKPHLFHDVFPALASIERFSKPPPFNVDVYGLTPSCTDIKREINNAKPFEKENRINSYIGMKVQWKCAFSGIQENENNYTVLVETEKVLHIVELVLDTSKDISRFKVMDEYTPFWVCGEISEISGIHMKLVNADFSL